MSPRPGRRDRPAAAAADHRPEGDRGRQRAGDRRAGRAERGSASRRPAAARHPRDRRGCRPMFRGRWSRGRRGRRGRSTLGGAGARRRVLEPRRRHAGARPTRGSARDRAADCASWRRSRCRSRSIPGRSTTSPAGLPGWRRSLPRRGRRSPIRRWRTASRRSKASSRRSASASACSAGATTRSHRSPARRARAPMRPRRRSPS